MVTLHTNFGDIKIKLDFDKAPVTAENFLNYCKEGCFIITHFSSVLMPMIHAGGDRQYAQKATKHQPNMKRTIV